MKKNAANRKKSMKKSLKKVEKDTLGENNIR
jgi:hypothetical protein